MPQATLDHADASPALPRRESSASELVASLRQLVQQDGRRWQLIVALQALGLCVAAPLAYLWLVFFLDNWLHLPTLGRVLAFLGFGVGVIAAATFLVRRWAALSLSEDQVALAIERRTPGGVHNRLINAVQLARDGRPARPDLTDAVVEENYQRLQQLRLERAAQFWPALLCAGLGVLLLGIGLAYGVLWPDHLGNAAARIFMPLADIEPLYRTRLDVEPGDVEAAGDVTIRVTVRGQRPQSLTLLRREQGKLDSVVVALEPGDGPGVHTFRDVTRDFTYAVRGGDFTSPYYQVTVPRKAALLRLRVTYHYPEYTRLPERTVETTGGDLEALRGSWADVAFVFDQPLDRVKLNLNRPAAARVKSEPQPLARQDDGKEFTAQLRFEDVIGYRLEMQQGDRPVQRTAPFSLRVLEDQPPKLELTGLEPRTEVQPDSVLPLQITASDDFGLEQVGLFYRRASLREGRSDAEGWQQVAVWFGDRKQSLRVTHELTVAGLSATEGDKLEVALRGIDTDPLRKGAWTTGAIYQLAVGGEGVALQLQYEQIVRSEADLKALARSEEELLAKVAGWVRKLDAGDLRLDDPKSVEGLHTAVKALAQEHETVRKRASAAAQAMVGEAGNLRIAVAMLADTEMVRVFRILDSVASRDQPQAKRAALADGRITQERILRSLTDLQEQYGAFRSDWELSHMIPFTKMLAERQGRMRDQSRQYAGRGAGSADAFQRQSVGRRQQKLIDLCGLIQPALAGLAVRLKEQETILAEAFQSGAATLAGEPLRQPMGKAAEDARAGRWAETGRQQALAADVLTSLHERLRKAQVEAARKALAALKEKAKTDLQAQKELEKLAPGSPDSLVKDVPENFKVEDLQRIREVVGAKKRPGDGKDGEPDYRNTPFEEVTREEIELKKDSGVRQDPYILQLGNVAEPTGALKIPSDKERNVVKPFIQEKFDDLVGKLLNEADELHKNYQTLNLSTNRNNNDGGEVGKIGGKLNSTGAVTATGNKKPPTMESGGVSRTGRQGARAYGMIADQDTYNRKGRDKALDGQLEVADQAGKNKMKSTDEDQKDGSTGVGGKKVESNDSHFSTHDAGKWKDEYAKRLEKPQPKHYIVERQGDKFDAKSAAMLRDLTSKQEQVIERLKSIKKELKNLYLPTEHLDDLAKALQSNLESLKEQPDADLFRLQLQALERLRGAMRVFQTASASFQPSLPRERIIRGRVLDEPARLALPGYEEAVKQYYLRLATQ